MSTTAFNLEKVVSDWASDNKLVFAKTDEEFRVSADGDFTKQYIAIYENTSPLGSTPVVRIVGRKPSHNPAWADSLYCLSQHYFLNPHTGLIRAVLTACLPALSEKDLEKLGQFAIDLDIPVAKALHEQRKLDPALDAEVNKSIEAVASLGYPDWRNKWVKLK